MPDRTELEGRQRIVRRQLQLLFSASGARVPELIELPLLITIDARNEGSKLILCLASSSLTQRRISLNVSTKAGSLMCSNFVIVMCVLSASGILFQPGKIAE